MGIYEGETKEFRHIAESYMQRGEIYRVSKPVLFEGKKYYEIVYNKKFLGTMKKEVLGRVIVDESGQIVSGRDIQKGVSRLFYYYSILFERGISELSRSVKSDIQLKREEEEYAQGSSILQYLSDEGVAGAGKVKGIVDSLPSMKREANDVLKTLILKIEEYDNSDAVFSQDVLNDLMPVYEKTLVMNFERVKYINTASRYYDDIKKAALSRRRKLKNRMDRKLQDAAMRLDNIISFFINILKYYDTFISYSSDRYRKYIAQKDIENINKIYKELRSK